MNIKSNRDREFRIGIITQVDPPNRFIIMKDQQGSPIRISLHLLDSVSTSLPKPGERWMATRKGIDWFLDKRVDDGIQPMPITKMGPGDSQISSSNNTFIIAPELVIISGSKSHIFNLDIKQGFTIEDGTKISGHIADVQSVVFPLTSGIDSWGILPGISGTAGTMYGGNHIEVPITMPNVRLGDNVYVSPLSSPGSGTIWSARVVEDGIVAISLANTTTSGLRIPPTLRWSIDVWQHRFDLLD